MRRDSVVLKLKHYRQSNAPTITAHFAYLTLSVLINSCWQFNFGCPNSVPTVGSNIQIELFN